MLKILHVITSLDTGGAQAMLQRLIANSDRERFSHAVVSLRDLGPVGQELAQRGSVVTALDMPNVSAPMAMLRLRRIVRETKPALVKSWMYHADLAAVLTARLRAHRPVVWGIHNTTVAPGDLRRSTMAIVRTCAVLSHRLPARIACDSTAAMREHCRIGYDSEKFVIIPNGFDTSVFSPPARRSDTRRLLGLPVDRPLVGLAARFDPMKDHLTFVRAAACVAAERPDVHFALCGGNGIDWTNAELVGWVDELGLRDRIHLLGRLDDLSSFMGVLDVGVSSSRSESFPLSVGELMSSGVPCVVTDVGDSAMLVGDTGLVVPAVSPRELGHAILAILREDPVARSARGEAARQRVVSNFSLRRTVSDYETLFQNVVAESSQEREQR